MGVLLSEIPQPCGPAGANARLKAAAAVEIGCLAGATLRRRGAGRIVAAFERSFYVQFGDGWICVGNMSIGSGPLNVVCDARPSRAAVGDAVWVRDSTLWGASGPLVQLASASIWRPDAIPAWSAASLRQGLEVVDDLWTGALTEGGLAAAGCAAPASDPPLLLKVAAPGLAAVREFLSAPDHQFDPMGFGCLIGLGPGLTPSGDDLIGGVLIALAALSRTELRDRLWRHCLELTEHTNDISRVHLRAAALGFGAVALHRAIHATMTGKVEDLGPALAALTAIGHTSGRDAFAGSLIVLRHAVGRS